jgi:1,4-dihydroxy-2-naphthoate octaprenyltransferase
MMIKTWISAFRLRTLFLSLACIMMGYFLASANGFKDSSIFSFCLLTALFLQILSNLANDYGDSIHGADHDGRKGPKRAVQSGKITKEQMKKAIGILIGLSLLSGISLLYFSYEVIGLYGVVSLFTLGIASIIAAITYTNGKKPYGYAGLGDISVFIFFGLVAVCGTYYLQVGSLDWDVIFPSVSCGLFSVAVLNVNNMRDIDSDMAAGKKSIPARIGFQNAKFYHLFIILSALISLISYSYMHNAEINNYIYLITVLPFILTLVKIFKTDDKQSLDPLLKVTSLSTFVLVILFGLFL